MLVTELRISAAPATPDWTTADLQYSGPDPIALQAPTLSEWITPPESLRSGMIQCNTPFLAEFRFPIGSLFGGRVHISGFGDTLLMANFKWGLYGAGSISGLNLNRALVPGLIEPANESSYGLSITLSGKGKGDLGMASRFLHCAGRLAERKKS